MIGAWIVWWDLVRDETRGQILEGLKYDIKDWGLYFSSMERILEGFGGGCYMITVEGI